MEMCNHSSNVISSKWKKWTMCVISNIMSKSTGNTDGKNRIKLTGDDGTSLSDEDIATYINNYLLM